MSDDDDGGAIAGFLIGAAIVVAVVAAVIAGFVSFGLAWGALCSLRNFILALCAHIAERSGNVEERAYVRYFHWKGDWLTNFKNISRETWRRNMAMVPEPISASDWKGTAFNLAKAAALVLSTFIVLPILFVILLAVFLVVFFVYGGISFVIRAFSFCVDKIYGLFNLCPSCHMKIPLPLYICPNCGVEHEHLVPSAKFGPFRRRCQCGAWLPTVRILGRSKLNAVCPGCRRPLDNEQFAPASIVLVGGSSVGKSLLMMDSVFSIKDHLAASLGWTVSIPNDDKPKVDALVRNYNSGILPNITLDSSVEAVCMEVRASGWLFPKRLYLYDPPGESFRAVTKVARHKYYEHMRVVVFVVDPSTIPGVMSEYDNAGVTFSISQTGAQTAEDSFNRWQISMEQEYGELISKTSCAVVIGKADEPSLKKLTGLAAGDGDEECRRFLRKFECGNLLSLLDSSFSKVSCFAVGAVGQGGNGSQFAPSGLDEMLKWIFQEI